MVIRSAPTHLRAAARTPGAPPRNGRSSSAKETALVELRIRGAPVAHWMQDLSTRWGAGVRLHVCRYAGGSPGRHLQLLEINAPPAAIAEIATFLRQQRQLEEVSLTRLAENRLLVRIISPLPPLCDSVFKMGAICMSCPFLPSPADSEGEAREGDWRVLVHHGRDARPLLTSFTAPGTPPPSLIRIGAYQGDRNLTARQELAVGTAFALGYYDLPRRAQLRDVAKALGVSRAAVMESLRRGMRKLASRRQREVGAMRSLVG